MFVHMTLLKIDPEKMPLASRVLMSQEIDISGLKAEGLRQAFFIESLDEPGRAILLAVWDSMGDSRSFISSPVYVKLSASLAPYLQMEPQWYEYHVLEPWIS